MTDDELRKLAEAVVALPEPNPEQHALVGVIGTMRELARAVLRLLEERSRLLRLKRAAESMRRVHEGCVMMPGCGTCDRCEFDAAVDALPESP
jgi:hypothetical protein